MLNNGKCQHCNVDTPVTGMQLNRNAIEAIISHLIKIVLVLWKALGTMSSTQVLYTIMKKNTSYLLSVSVLSF
jgi:hypothetical protein